MAHHYTGQRWDSGTGLYWYRSRWYDPTLARFIQPDTLVPNPGDPQSLNRYSYVGNNPVRFRDPSGHGYCEDLDCAVKTDARTGHLAGLGDKWGISMSGPWESQNEWIVYEGMQTISERVGQHLKDSRVAVSGDKWVRKNIGGTVFERWPNNRAPLHPILLLTGLHTLIRRWRGAPPIWPQGPSGLSLPAHYPLLDNPKDTIYFFDTMDETTPVHEAGHIVDYRSNYASVDMARLVRRQESPTAYGKTSWLEDFAESWMYWVYENTGLTIDRQTVIESLVVQSR